MPDLNPLEALLEGRFDAPPVCVSEQDYYRTWQAHGLNQREPTDMALLGGLLADRPAWIFAAGYQATQRNAFRALPADGWAAFAATEDDNDAAAHPPVTLDTDNNGATRISGCKAWVGHSALVDHLVVTINDPDGDKHRARGAIVPRNAPGVTLTHRELPRFLPAMSQGFARFEDTPVAAAAMLEFEPIRQFGRTEAKFVMLAATAFMAREVDGELRDQLLTTAAAIVSLLGESNTSRQVYGAIDRHYQQCASAFLDEFDGSGLPAWDTDKRLFTMYTARIQRRVGYARAEHESASPAP